MPPHNGQRPPRCNPLFLSRLVLPLLYALAHLRRARWSAVVLLVGGCCGCQDGGEVVGGGARCCALVWLDGGSGRRGCGVGLLSYRKNKI